ncbi:hypothetical protein T4D_15602 [Trichinella pseudospiralis]|uniref:Uncharacterized protein n=1 Tax=Trichinella pseudospiralis TaxID=6337 RepID=A0A0V1DT32_TRIPS|nr:hypothetical protein T4D_15602 [Trichinella pseudospiralis]
MKSLWNFRNNAAFLKCHGDFRMKLNAESSRKLKNSSTSLY